MSATCRLCHGWKCDQHSGPMMKYSVRHYAHARCGIVRFGREWLDKQPRWIMAQFPWFLAKDLMIEDYVRARIAETGEWSHMQKSEAEDATTKR